MADEIETKQELRQQAQQRVERFSRRFGEPHLLLAYHAALPLVLTPELVNYLRNQFLRSEQVSWVAEVDLLLSDLCNQVGYELYAMDTHIRAYLLEEMRKHYEEKSDQKMQQVAQVLISYVNYLSRLNPGRRQQELEAQRWAAMVYLGEKECKQAVKEIAQRLLDNSENLRPKTINSEVRAELTRLARLTEELSPKLEQETNLVNYAKYVQEYISSSRGGGLKELYDLRKSLEEDIKFNETSQVSGLPEIKIFEFEVATITIAKDEDNTTIELQSFNFTVAKIELKRSGWLRQTTKLSINKQQKQAQQFIEDLGNGIKLEMVAIPGGSFIMGSPENEPESRDSEKPQHEVSIKPFCMGKYPITQAQWQAVAQLPQVNKELKPDPSYFKGANRPVESVSWDDAVEFCARLSAYTKRPYRLPSEAEWEYACRAGTTTPFHFGETITTDLANYDGTDNKEYKWSGSYGKGPKGVYREETIEVGYFKVANEFGLYDMHGNVWEWCQDDWHDNYEDAPIDGSAWISVQSNNNKKVLRGGSWGYLPGYCRSASRSYIDAGFDNYYNGFRVVCGAAWTL